MLARYIFHVCPDILKSLIQLISCFILFLFLLNIYFFTQVYIISVFKNIKFIIGNGNFSWQGGVKAGLKGIDLPDCYVQVFQPNNYSRFQLAGSCDCLSSTLALVQCTVCSEQCAVWPQQASPGTSSWPGTSNTARTAGD